MDGLTGEGVALAVPNLTPTPYAGSLVTNRSGTNRMAYRPGLSKDMMPGPISILPPLR